MDHHCPWYCYSGDGGGQGLVSSYLPSLLPPNKFQLIFSDMQGQQLCWFFKLQVLLAVFVLFSGAMFMVMHYWAQCIYYSLG